MHMVCTSPPYWGLRDYGLTPSVWGGDPEHTHEWGKMERGKRNDILPADVTCCVARIGTDNRQNGAATNGGHFCSCGAWRGVLGLEPTPEAVVATTQTDILWHRAGWTGAARPSPMPSPLA
jgi:hypothetical protein